MSNGAFSIPLPSSPEFTDDTQILTSIKNCSSALGTIRYANLFGARFLTSRPAEKYSFHREHVLKFWG